MIKKDKRILVVDDDVSILDAVSMILREEGFTVETSPKGEETFAKVDTFKPHLILLDILMSGHDGREICQRLKADDKTKHIPIVMISAHPSAKDSATDFGAEDFLPKPFGTEELLNTISLYLKPR